MIHWWTVLIAIFIWSLVAVFAGAYWGRVTESWDDSSAAITIVVMALAWPATPAIILAWFIVKYFGLSLGWFYKTAWRQGIRLSSVGKDA